LVGTPDTVTINPTPGVDISSRLRYGQNEGDEEEVKNDDEVSDFAEDEDEYDDNTAVDDSDDGDYEPDDEGDEDD
jgi:hypothetical protein